jgi:molybdopterin-guanine dinucleotide biosynthesis protein
MSDAGGWPGFGEGNSRATTAMSFFLDDATLAEKVRSQLDFLSLGQNFPSLFDGLPRDDRRRIARLARLQVVQKRQWLHKVWLQFDPTASEESLLETLQQLADDDGTGMNGLFRSAKEVARRFLWVDGSGLFPNIHCFICGPRFGGKTTLLRTLLLEFLVIFTNTNIFKSIFIVSLDFRRSEITSVESFYRFVASSVATALLGQRPDLQLFAHSLSNGFSELLSSPRVRHLPKPISSQDYLRRPMRAVDHVLESIHHAYHEPTERHAFVDRVAGLPQTIAEIFGFSTTLLVVDHLDAVPRSLGGLDLMGAAVASLSRTQSIVSAGDCGAVFPSKRDWVLVSVADKCVSEFRDRVLTVQFRNRAIPPVTVRADDCGGCPTFVSRFDDVCRSIIKREQLFEEVKREEQMVRTGMLVEILLDMLMTFGELAQDGGTPEVVSVSMHADQIVESDGYGYSDD